MRLLLDGWRRLRATGRGRDLSDATLVAVVGVLVLAAGVPSLRVVADGFGADAGTWVHLVPLAAGCAVMLGKRRRPVLALVAGSLLFGVDLWLGGSLGTLLVLLDLLYSAAMFTGRLAAARLRTTIASLIVVGTGLTAVATGELLTTVLVGLQLFALLGTPWWWGTSVRQQAELARLATERADDLRRLAALNEAETVARERARMARDLHDAIAGNLSAIAIHAEAALAVPAGTPAAAERDRAALESVRAASVTSLREMRSMIDLLRSGEEDGVGSGASDPATGGAGTAAAPPRLAQAGTLVEAARASGLDFRWAGVPVTDLPPLTAAVDQAAYRILQESLTNAAKHAPGGRVVVTVRRHDDELELGVDTFPREPAASSGADVVADDTGTRAGMGMMTMRERAEAVGGRFRAGWADDGGWLDSSDTSSSGPAPAQRDRWSVVAVLPLDGPAVEAQS